jgi:type IV pilus assembly protein PilO
MDLNQINELDFNTMGEWPLAAKAVVIGLLCLIVGYGWYHLSTSNQILMLDKAKQKEEQLRQEFITKQKKAANLDAYVLQLAEMNESFGAMLKRLPDKTEVAALLIDVSQTGLASGLEFELFQPSGERARDFYAELPIKVRVTGYYHQFGQFISGLASLPRIVTIHDVNISGVGKRGELKAQQTLRLDATVKTYRYLDENTLQ